MAPRANSSQPEASPPARLTRLKCFQSVSLNLEEPIVVLHILFQVTGQKTAEGQVECWNQNLPVASATLSSVLSDP